MLKQHRKKIAVPSSKPLQTKAIQLNLIKTIINRRKICPPGTFEPLAEFTFSAFPNPSLNWLWFPTSLQPQNNSFKVD